MFVNNSTAEAIKPGAGEPTREIATIHIALATIQTTKAVQKSIRLSRASA